jgi:tRNA-specific 2-thiouridylase
MNQGAGRIAVALSGGVDSAVAAQLLLRQGWEVVGVHLRLGESREAWEHLQTLARRLGFTLWELDVRQAFAREVVDYFTLAYRRGETPNPCVRCNAAIKFGVLWDYLQSQGIDFLATGHYVRREALPTGEVAVWRGADRAKDQSYFLHRLPRPLLPQFRFPLGGLTKGEVRGMFVEMGLPPWENCTESQDLCFVGERRYIDFLRTRCQAGAPGDLVDRQGRVLGRHRGVECYTVGQRRGLGVPAQEPYYVLALSPATNRVVIGPREQLYAEALQAREVNWLIQPPAGELTATAVIRYRHTGVAAVITPLDGGNVQVRFATPQKAVTPGQAVAFYEGDRLLGGGWIETAL